MATKRTLPRAALQQTLAYLFDGQPHALARPVEHWITTSKPFARFVQTYQSKIRKKARTAQEAEQSHNLYCELRTAYLLLQEPAFAVEYEPHAKQHGRSPDFAVTYRTHTRFYVEVTRLRLPQQEQPLDQRQAGEDDDGPTHGQANRNLEDNNPAEHHPQESAAMMQRYRSRRLADVVCDKIGQLAPGAANVLWMWVQSQGTQEIELEPLMLGLKRRAEQRDAALLARYGFRHPADFIHHYQRLSLVLVQPLQAPDERPLVWSNNDARHPLPAKVRNLLDSLITADSSQDFMPDAPASSPGQPHPQSSPDRS
ncbi:MAG TPA: hypothetical protein VNK95_02035 [Caldilineaceae bacterium]|nr:hypothetical protein [Caldilineaceae bacterium]